MKIVFIINDLGSYYNFLNELCIDLSMVEGNEVHVICSIENIIKVSNHYGNVVDKIRFHTINIPRSGNLFKLIHISKKVNSLLLAIEPNLVHAHFLAAALSGLIFKNKNVKYFVTLHGLGFNSVKGYRKLIYFLSEFYVFWRAEKIFVINNSDKAFVFKYFPNKVEKLNCCGVGCDINRFVKNSDENNQRLRYSIGINSDALVITYTGRFVKFKGFDIVVRTFLCLQENTSLDIYLLLIGGKDDLHEDGLSSFEWDLLNKTNKIIEVGFTNSVHDYLSISNLFFFPSVKEGLPVSVMEALSVGLPVVGFDTRGVTDLIINNFNGIIIPSSSDSSVVGDFVEILSFLAANPHEISRLSKNALSIRSNYSRELFIKESINYYKKYF